MKKLFWFRRDRRLQDNESLAIAADADELHALFVFPSDFSDLTPLRQASFVESARSLDASLPGGLNLAFAPAAQAIAEYVKQHDIDEVVATRAFDTSGMIEQSDVAAELFALGVPLRLAGSYYAIEPGTVLKDDGTPLRVYTPFYRRWSLLPQTKPIRLDVSSINWSPATKTQLPDYPKTSFRVRAGEDFALATLDRFVEKRLAAYEQDRNRTDLAGTSHLSHALAHGEIHPRTILAAVGYGANTETFRKEIAWREFYADVMFHNPHTLKHYFDEKYARMRYADPTAPKDAERLLAWQRGLTGFPIVDAAMRQLVQSGWMHNRARMIVASFLVKDLHFEWQLGAQFFESQLTDFDPASNSHGWQWTAGCGTDASPYYRVFNPILQGVKFDPEGDYVRRWIPELRHVPGAAVHEPWKLIDGLSKGYLAPIVDHQVERDEALARLAELKS